MTPWDTIFQSVKFWPRILVPRDILHNHKKIELFRFPNGIQFERDLSRTQVLIQLTSFSDSCFSINGSSKFWLKFSPLSIPSSKSQKINYSANLFKLCVIWSSNILQGQSSNSHLPQFSSFQKFPTCSYPPPVKIQNFPKVSNLNLPPIFWKIPRELD